MLILGLHTVGPRRGRERKYDGLCEKSFGARCHYHSGRRRSQCVANVIGRCLQLGWKHAAVK